MNSRALLRAVAASSREPQNAIAEAVERFLDDGSRAALCVHAETGVGKTLAYGAPATLAASRGRKVVISTHTTQQLGQVLAALREVAGAVTGAVPVARRLGRANFLSSGRIARVLANRDDLDEDDRALLGAARRHAGLIDDFERDHGALPVPRADVCLTSSCTDQAAWERQREDSDAAGIVVQTHAMSVLDAVRGEVDADLLIFDEADTLPSAAAGFAEARVTPFDLMAVQDQRAPRGLARAVDAFEAWAGGIVGAAGVVFKQDHPEAAVHAGAVRRALPGPETEHVRDLRRALGAFVRLDSTKRYRGAAVVAMRDGHAFQVLALDPGRVLRRTFAGRKALFVSATLAVGSGGLEPFLRTVGAEDLDGARDRLRVDLAKFGSMSFALADRAVPAPFDGDGERAPAFDDYAAAIVRRALSEGGRTLVLAPSFADVDALNRRIEGLVAHRRGEALAAYLEGFVAAPNAALATPAAWAGTDLPGLLSHVVILRIPFPPPEAGRAELLRRLLEARGYDPGQAERILRAQGRRDALRRLAQGLGRGIRGPEDRVKVWIADPRFPLPDTLVRDPRRLLNQGLAAHNGDLSGAIPRRFAEAYEGATIVSRDPEPASG
ncbi:MAG: hypothetical protein OXC08_08120 [Thiotrichales bacterium]|nr:hypothetical protein [Thiotrichales bacterium]